MAGWLAALSAGELATLFADAGVAQDWWYSLSDDQRIAFVATRPDGIDGVLGEVVETVEGRSRR